MRYKKKTISNWKTCSFICTFQNNDSATYHRRKSTGVNNKIHADFCLAALIGFTVSPSLGHYDCLKSFDKFKSNIYQFV